MKTINGALTALVWASALNAVTASSRSRGSFFSMGRMSLGEDNDESLITSTWSTDPFLSSSFPVPSDPSAASWQRTARGGSAFASPRIPSSPSSSSSSPRSSMGMATSGVIDHQSRQNFLDQLIETLHQSPQAIRKQLRNLPFWRRSDPVVEGPPVEQVLGIHEPKAIAMPIFGQNVWEEQTGREFVEDSSLVDDLVKTALQVSAQQPNDDNPWIEWSSSSDDESTGDLLDDESIQTWTGKSRIQGHGSQAPWIKTRAIVPFSPTLLSQLLMDSARIQSYDERSAERKDLWFNLAGASSTKISRHRAQTPFGGPTEYHSLLHARPVSEGSKNIVDNVNPSWLMVSRAVADKPWSQNDSRRPCPSKVLLGVNLMEAVPGRPDATLLTTISHVHDTGDDEASSSGLKPAVQFVQCLRNLHAKQKRGPSSH